MAESGLAGRFWFKAALAGKDTRNVTYKQRLGQAPYSCMYGELKDVSRLRAFGCREWICLNAERREKGKHSLSTSQERKKHYVLDLIPIPTHGHSSFHTVVKESSTV